jgi:glycosyltransferase involved in cell wall biosynthesis
MAPLRVLYDHQVFTWQRYGGISRYFADLLKYLPTETSVVPSIALRYSDNAYLHDTPSLAASVLPKNAVSLPLHARLMRRYRSRYEAQAKNHEHTLSLLAKGDFDIFHPTYFEPYFLDHLRGKPWVITVYDLMHEVFPEYYLSDTRIRTKELLVQKADRVIAISHATKKDLVNVYGVPAEKIDVVHLATSFSPETCPAAKLDLPEKFFLYVGDRGKYKNCYFMIRALREILQKTPGLHLICAGGGSFDGLEHQFLESLGLSDRVRHHDASNASLVALYQRAIALIFPSLYEGFGLPVTEAFNCGCPVLSSRATALAEVAGDAALYFDGKDILSIRDAVEQVLKNPGLLALLREKGKVRAQAFSPEKCARETAAVYARVLGRQSPPPSTNLPQSSPTEAAINSP